MEYAMSILAGLLFAIGVYFLLEKQLLKVIIGTVLLSHGAHLMILTMGGLKKGAPPVLEDYISSYTDPLPQALILTSIVISFGVTSFLLVLAYRTFKKTKTDRVDQLRGSDDD
ncbi:Na(+)/H(+) antiporter subunit C [Aureibacillus halotolerans]|uniref:Multisubunit sodium/proton antiporter MrpC subunit n=1 Tax=Aureibacillus halotolerans TaxID=1508390 RepID=A0A4R6TXJ7_9BACI|nr:Na(+)/H(+) antiporter subunit C [Aureibacillus halotolerans]TDQ38026.1 multisubunit sodium/proton antiporter MrpC subunit [Aureibacillus halotolerans]